MITNPSRVYLQVPPAPAPGIDPSTAQGTTAAAALAAPGPRDSAPYGYACSNCSKAKCKCISRRGASCERCARLGRECRPSNGVRKRAATRRPPSSSATTAHAGAASRTAQLEEKLDDLVSILRAQAAVGGGGGDVGQPASIIADQIGIEDARAVAAVAAAGAGAGGGPCVVSSPDPNPGGGGSSGRPLGNGHHVLTPADSHGYGTSTASSTPVASSSSPDMPLSTAQAEETLQLFRQHHLKTFPFVYIQPEMSAAQLASERPYLWLNIRAICSKSPSQRSALGLRCREITAKRVLVDMERNIDLLIGVLAYLGWAMHQFFGKPQLVAMMNIAITLVTDLRLDRPTKDSPNREENCFKSYVYPRVPISVVRTNEERRATIACYAFCSNVSMFLKSQSMRWTPHMEDSLRKLAAYPECPEDELLVTIVRAHRIIEDVAQVTWRSIDQDGMNGLSPSSRPPPMLYVKSLRQNLQAIKDGLPESQMGNKIAMSYLYATEMIICDMPFWNNNPWISASPRRNSGNSSGSGSGTGSPRAINLGRLEAYHATLQASRACMDNFLGLPPPAYVGFSFPLVMHFFRSTQILYRLLLTEDPDWDRAAVAGEIDLMAAIERGAARFALVAGTYGFESESAAGSGAAAAAGEGTGTGVGVSVSARAGKENRRGDVPPPPVDDDGNDPNFVGYTHLDFYTKCARTLRSTIPVWNAALAQIGLGRSSSASGGGGGSSSDNNNISNKSKPRSASGDRKRNRNRNGSIVPAAAIDTSGLGTGPGADANSSVTGMGAGNAAMEHQLAMAPMVGCNVGFAEFMPAAMDFMDDSWWTDILGSWET